MHTKISSAGAMGAKQSTQSAKHRASVRLRELERKGLSGSAKQGSTYNRGRITALRLVHPAGRRQFQVLSQQTCDGHAIVTDKELRFQQMSDANLASQQRNRKDKLFCERQSATRTIGRDGTQREKKRRTRARREMNHTAWRQT